ncbi:MAG: hydrogenase [Candidatus Binatia bacterium]
MRSTDALSSPMVSDLGRRTVWHGVVLFLLALIGGLFIAAMANPRMGLSMHTGTLLNATFLIALGAAWSALELSPRAERAAFAILVLSSYGGSLGLLLAALLGTRDSTPLHGAALSASAWKEALVMVVLTVNGIAIMVGCVVVLRGLGHRRGVS